MTDIAVDIWVPPYPLATISNPTSAVIDATGEKVAYIGQVHIPDGVSRSIQRVQFMFGSVTKAGGSGLTASLQDVDFANGPPFQPDGTQDQTVAIANGDATFATNTWHRSGTLSSNRSVADGDWLAFVVEFDGSGRLGSDSAAIAFMFNSNPPSSNFGVSHYTGSWAQVSATINLVLEFSDGTFGTLLGSFPQAVTGVTVAFNSGSAADEIGMEFVAPFTGTINGAWALFQIASGADAELVLYSGTTALATAVLDANVIRQTTASNRTYVSFGSEVPVTQGQTYRLILKPTTGNGVTLLFQTLAHADHRSVLPFGAGYDYVTRVDGGAFAAPDTTRRPVMGVRYNKLTVGSGGGLAAPLFGGGVI